MRNKGQKFIIEMPLDVSDIKNDEEAMSSAEAVSNDDYEKLLAKVEHDAKCILGMSDYKLYVPPKINTYFSLQSRTECIDDDGENFQVTMNIFTAAGRKKTVQYDISKIRDVNFLYNDFLNKSGYLQGDIGERRFASFLENEKMKLSKSKHFQFTYKDYGWQNPLFPESDIQCERL